MVLLIAIVVLALVFDYTNGFHDSANAIATSVSTRALSPRVAVVMAAGLNLLGALVYTSVAKTVGEGLERPEHPFDDPVFIHQSLNRVVHGRNLLSTGRNNIRT